MKTLSLNLIRVLEKLFYSETKKEAKESKKMITKKSHFNTQKLYHDGYENLTLEQQLIINQIRVGI